jgi:hypothetical protein
VGIAREFPPPLQEIFEHFLSFATSYPCKIIFSAVAAIEVSLCDEFEKQLQSSHFISPALVR